TMLVVVLKLLFTPFFGMADEFSAWVQADGRDACFGEREVIGAVKRALLRSGVWRYRQVVLFCDFFDEFAQRRTVGAERRDVSRHAQRVHRIEVDVGNRLLKWNERMARVIFRAQQPLLFGRGGDEKD